MQLVHHLMAGLTAAAFCLLPVGCTKWISVPPPPGSPPSAQLFSSEASARGVLSGVYYEMAIGPSFSSSLATLYGGLAADELYDYAPGLTGQFTRNELSPPVHSLLSTGLWQPAYRSVYTANIALEKLPAAPLPQDVKAELIGEALFIRAFSYSQLVSFFGGVPLVRTADYRQAMNIPRTTAEEILQLMVQDLEEAAAALPERTLPEERLRPGRGAAIALRARLHLYRGEWEAAAAAASEVIGSGRYRLTTHPSEVFVTGSPETIFFLPAPPPHYRLAEAAAFVPLTEAALPTYCLRRELLDAFEPGDARREAWTGSRTYGGQAFYYPAKYPHATAHPDQEAYTVLRLAELYLVRAEALAQLEDTAAALADLNVIRQRAGLPPLSSLEREALLEAIRRERRVELAFEWGHRWNDLRRWGKATAVLAPLKGATWQPTDTLWPLPEDQLLLNPALTQNPGY